MLMTRTTESEEHSRLRQLIRFSLIATAKKLGADITGLAFCQSAGNFLHFTFNNRSAFFNESNLSLPPRLLEQLSSTLFLQFPDTAFLPVNPSPNSAMISCKRSGNNLLSVFWVGKFRSSKWTEREVKEFEAIGNSLSNSFFIAMPMFLKGNFIRPWLEASTNIEPKICLEESLSQLLELLLFASSSKDGAILMTDLNGKILFGIAKGEDGQRLLEAKTLPETLHRSFVTKIFSESSWRCIIAVKASKQANLGLLRLIEASAQIVKSLIWGIQCSQCLKVYALLDPVTKLPNREAFNKRLEIELNKSVRFGYPLSLILVDINDFKAFNEVLGYEAGDQILREVASIIRRFVRNYDFVARYSGDKFAIILPAASLEKALIVADRIKAKLAETEIATLKDNGLVLKVSMGLTTVQRATPDDLTQVLSLVEKALLASKVEGGTGLEFAISSEFTKPETALPEIPPELWQVVAQYLSHNINNPLNGILGMAQISQMDEGLSPNLKEAFKEIEQQALRLRDFTRHLTNLPPKQVAEELEAFRQRICLHQLPHDSSGGD